MAVLNKKKKKRTFLAARFSKMNVVHMNTEEALRSPGCDNAKKTTTEIIRCSRLGLVSRQEHNNTAAIWSGRTNEAHKKIWSEFSCLLSHILKKKSFETQEITGFSSRRSRGAGDGGGCAGHWEEFTASAALSSIEARTSIHLIPPPLRLSTACRSCGCRHRRFWQFHRAAQRFQWDERALVTGADKRGAATSQRSSSTQKQK